MLHLFATMFDRAIDRRKAIMIAALNDGTTLALLEKIRNRRPCDCVGVCGASDPLCNCTSPISLKNVGLLVALMYADAFGSHNLDEYRFPRPLLSPARVVQGWDKRG